MRWFTDDAYESFGDGEWRAMLEAYSAHLTSILDRLPPDLTKLATDPRYHLHDALIRELRVDREGRAFEMRLRVVGGIKVSLRFEEADLVGENLQALAYALGAEYRGFHGSATYTEVIAQEVELAVGGRFLFRLRLTPFHEFALEFGSMTLRELRGRDDEPRRRTRLVFARPRRR